MMDFSAWIIGIGLLTYSVLIYIKLDRILDELKEGKKGDE